jgi:hypothetical protein
VGMAVPIKDLEFLPTNIRELEFHPSIQDVARIIK